MKNALLLVAVLFSSLEMYGAAPEKQMIELRIVEASRNAVVTVEMSNASNKPLRLWKESNSWGAARWRVAVIKKDKLVYLFQNPDQDFTKNNPVFAELQAGEQVTHQLDLNGGNWCARGKCTLFGDRRSSEDQIQLEPGDRIIVSYDVPASIESRNNNVWYGVAAVLTTIR